MNKILQATLALAGFAAISGAGVTNALAQSAECEAYRAELSALSRGADPRAQEYVVAAQRQRAELERTRAYFVQIGCERSDSFRMQNECGSLRAHMQQMQANLREMLATADQMGGGQRSEARKRQLQAALDSRCAFEPQRPRGLLERLFGGSGAVNDTEPPPYEEPMAPVVRSDDEGSLGGSQPVCVRLADGYFFPLGARFLGRDQARQLCQAQCPASQTELFFMAQGGTIQRSESVTGAPYSTLPAALSYQKKLTPGISCLPAGQTWQQALQGAEALLGSHEDDILVTAEKADELSRPKGGATGKTAAAAAAATAAAAPAGDEDVVADAASLPTGGGESAGIGPATLDSKTTISQQDGPTITAPAADGSTRRVRVVAPYLIPAAGATRIQ